MKIALVSTIKPSLGTGLGISEYTYQLTKHLKVMDKNLKIDNIYAIPEPKRNNILGLLYTNTIFKLKIKKLSKTDYDIVHITDHEIGFVAKILKKSDSSAKVVTTIHDLARFEKGLHRGLTQYIYNKLVQGSINDAINYSDYILCNSSQTYETIENRFGKKPNMKVVLHGTNDTIINTKIPKRQKKEVFTVGYIGALMKHKNVIFILKAAKLLDKVWFRFMIYGTGVDMPMLEEFKEDNSLSNVYIKGYLEEKNKVKAYDSFDAFVFPSLYEGLGYPILEAQARGLPVIIYKYGKIPKEVRRYCFEAESPEHMAQIIEELKENGYNEKERKRAMEYARSFTWERCGRETLEAYQKVLR
ncbi:MAG: glycosyltransferase family 4 protein [Thermoproteota archaeon]